MGSHWRHQRRSSAASKITPPKARFRSGVKRPDQTKQIELGRTTDHSNHSRVADVSSNVIKCALCES
jgi:hypothetical protein